MLSVAEAAWLAGIFDGEGCISFTRRNKGSATPCVSVCNTSKSMIMKICMLYRECEIAFDVTDRLINHPTKKPIYVVRVSRLKSVIKLTDEIIPYLVNKRVQAELVRESVILTFKAIKPGCTKPKSASMREPFANRVWQINKRGRPSNVTFFKEI